MIKHFTELVAKMATLPFTEHIFVKEALFDEMLKGEVKKKYQNYDELKKKVQHSLIGTQHIQSLDTINMLFEQYYPLKTFASNITESELYIAQLDRLTRSFITHRNGKIALKYWKNVNDEVLFGAFEGLNKIEMWNTLSRTFCIDILVVVYLLKNGMNNPAYLNGYYWLINLGDLQLDKIMERGLAENHIHISAGINFNLIWHNLMNINQEHSDIQIKSDWPILNALELDSLIKASGIIRILIFQYLVFSPQESFEAFILRSKTNEIYDIRDQQSIEELSELLRWYVEPQQVIQNINFKKLHVFVFENINFENGNITQSYEIIKEMSSLTELNTTDENIFLFKVMKYLINTHGLEQDHLLVKVFWQYIRIKNLVYQGVTQGNYMEGLDYFRYYFGRATSLSRKQLEHAIRNQIHNNNLKKLEIRVAPSNKKKSIEIEKDIRINLKFFFKVYKKLIEDPTLSFDKIPTIGIVYHFIKSQDETFYEKCWYKDSDRKSFQRDNYFYGKLQSKYKETIDIINKFRENIPHLSKYIVGIDAASVENNTEPWVFAPIFRYARDSQTSKVMSLHNNEKINTLGFTYHVGEEFRHLLSGLRHIDEVIEQFNYHVGDRIGHGIALGIDVKLWCHNNPIVLLPRIEYMENLLWLWGQVFMEKKYSNIEFDLLGLEREVMLQAEKIYHSIDGISMFALWKAYKGKFQVFHSEERYIRDVCISESNRTGMWRNEAAMPENHFCVQTSSDVAVWNESKLLHANHCKCFLERMYEVIQITVGDHEVALLELLQKYIREKLSQKGIVVEANPTSNLAISGIDRLFHHPIMNFNTNGLIGDGQADQGLVISINSDDPAVFNTSISNELAYIFYLLQSKGYPRDSILAWIEKIREWGLMTSFIENRAIEPAQLIAEFDEILEYLK